MSDALCSSWLGRAIRLVTWNDGHSTNSATRRRRTTNSSGRSTAHGDSPRCRWWLRSTESPPGRGKVRWLVWEWTARAFRSDPMDSSEGEGWQRAGLGEVLKRREHDDKSGRNASCSSWSPGCCSPNRWSTSSVSGSCGNSTAGPEPDGLQASTVYRQGERVPAVVRGASRRRPVSWCDDRLRGLLGIGRRRPSTRRTLGLTGRAVGALSPAALGPRCRSGVGCGRRSRTACPHRGAVRG